MHIILCSCLLVEVKERFGEENITTMIVTVVVLLLVVTSNVHGTLYMFTIMFACILICAAYKT